MTRERVYTHAMPRKNFWLTEQANSDLDALAERWGLSKSATVARALAEAVKRALRGAARN